MVEGYTSLMETPHCIGKPAGWMSAADWEQTLNVLEEAGMLKGKSKDLSVYYTNDLLQ
jgi:hypothetical protein